MFTGIIEAVGKVESVQREGSNLNLSISSAISAELKPDQSVSHNGVCLTVTKVEGTRHWVTAIDETLSKSNLKAVRAGTLLNLERSMVMNGRLDGHIVQGHVDQVGKVKKLDSRDGSLVVDIEYDPGEHVTVEKGSISVDGVSLTCFNSQKGSFSVAIIPFTIEHTNFKQLSQGDLVNLEFDIIGKYVRKMMDS